MFGKSKPKAEQPQTLAAALKAFPVLRNKIIMTDGDLARLDNNAINREITGVLVKEFRKHYANAYGTFYSEELQQIILDFKKFCLDNITSAKYASSPISYAEVTEIVNGIENDIKNAYVKEAASDVRSFADFLNDQAKNRITNVFVQKYARLLKILQDNGYQMIEEQNTNFDFMKALYTGLEKVSNDKKQTDERFEQFKNFIKMDPRNTVNAQVKAKVAIFDAKQKLLIQHDKSLAIFSDARKEAKRAAFYAESFAKISKELNKLGEHFAEIEKQLNDKNSKANATELNRLLTAIFAKATMLSHVLDALVSFNTSDLQHAKLNPDLAAYKEARYTDTGITVKTARIVEKVIKELDVLIAEHKKVSKPTQATSSSSSASSNPLATPAGYPGASNPFAHFGSSSSSSSSSSSAPAPASTDPFAAANPGFGLNPFAS